VYAGEFLINHCIQLISRSSFAALEPAPLGPLRQAVVFGPLLFMAIARIRLDTF
jgi:hypothetical protein